MGPGMRAVVSTSASRMVRGWPGLDFGAGCEGRAWGTRSEKARGAFLTQTRVRAAAIVASRRGLPLGQLPHPSPRIPSRHSGSLGLSPVSPRESTSTYRSRVFPRRGRERRFHAPWRGSVWRPPPRSTCQRTTSVQN